MGGTASVVEPALSAPDTDDASAGAALPPLDAAHRVAGPRGVDFSFRSALLRMDGREIGEVGQDCARVFRTQTASNWLPATAAPRCALERLARAIFDRHTDGVTYDVARSGAEWWAQVRDGRAQEEGIEFHWDVDEHFCDLPGRGGVPVHPTLSTLTHLPALAPPPPHLHTLRPPLPPPPAHAAPRHPAPAQPAPALSPADRLFFF